MNELDQKHHVQWKDHLINFTILLLIFSGVANIILSFPHTIDLIADIGEYYQRLSPDNIQIYGMVHRLIGVILIFLSYRLYKRMETAWYIATVFLILSVTLRMVHFHEFFSPMIFAEVFIFVVLFLCGNDFRRKSDDTSVKRALLIASGSVVIILINFALSLFLLRHEYHGLVTFYDALVQSVRILFLMDVSTMPVSEIGKRFLDAAIVFHWACILTALFYVLKPVIYQPIIHKRDRKKVYELVRDYGQNPMSYLALEDDKKYFFGKSVAGVIAFAVVNDVAVVCGDMICSDEAAPVFLAEFSEFCRENRYAILFLNVTDKYADLYRLMDFQTTKYGEDACFLLSEYNLAGGRVAKVRAAINHANRVGITVEEYRPALTRDEKIEREMQEISDLWLKSKKCGELSFMLGGMGLENPLERRFFVARDANQMILGFVVFVPYENQKAYLADVTRRRIDAPQGVIEKLIYDGFMALKADGVLWGNMGLVPLVNVAEGKEKTTLPEKMFEYVYENLNQFYDFKALHHAKEKYAPTHWVSRYIVYKPKRFTLQMAYAIVRVQNPKGIMDYVRIFGKAQWQKIRDFRKKEKETA